MYGFEIGEKIKHKYNGDVIYTICSFNKTDVSKFYNLYNKNIIEICTKNGVPYEGFDQIKNWVKIYPYQMEFNFSDNINASI